MQRVSAERRMAVGAGLWALSALALAAVPTQMKAIVQTGNGGPEVLKLETVPVVQPGDGQVLIRVYAVGVNPVDWKMRIGRAGPPPATPFPNPAAAGERPPQAPPAGPESAGPNRSIPGLDAAGVVAKVGSGVTTIKVGEPVFTMIGRSIKALNGTYAQYVLAPADNVVKKPKGFTYEQAAGIGTVGMTAERSVENAKISKGQRVLITGAAGGVGSSAAQIAKARGAYVIGTASARHADYLKSIGVDEVVDYTQGNFEDKVKDVDAVIDTVGGDTTARAVSTLKRGGILISVAGRAPPDKCAAAGVTCPAGGPPPAGPPTEGDYLRAVAKLADEGKFNINVDKTYPLAQGAEAQEFNRSGHTEGKLVLVVDAAKANTK
jgi:NADPH:quinone reductase-like Zn-dependent oxidoreductase